ncbi:SPOR domain-containing protein [Pinirhizobacter soli]|uniref:SPOR domain-containing protein n=1 Tax=Pinirhizobacter soli TaxID=2786953 RepID=UPI00202A380A|nr:SPOR domain-containing protein [Pinirhizobacter soli]
MLPRLIFVLLVALNIAVAAWLLFGGGGHFIGDVADEGVPRLKLVAETQPATTAVPASAAEPLPVSPMASAPIPASSAASPSAVPGKPTMVATASTTARPPIGQQTPAPAVLRPSPIEPPQRRTFRCVALGPFASDVDSRAARSALGGLVIRSRTRQETASVSHGWRVFLPPMDSREKANDMARRLQAKNVKDYFVVPAGPEPNSIALGVFNAQENARKRRDEVVALGFPARMAERVETTPSYWLDVVVGDDAKVNWQARARAPKIQARPTGCFQ